jgi:hypothetical protein
MAKWSSPIAFGVIPKDLYKYPGKADPDKSESIYCG